MTSAAPHARFGPVDVGPIDLDVPEFRNGDIEMEDAEGFTTYAEEKLVVSVDFGTTCSSVAYARVKGPYIHLDDIKWIRNYPDDPSKNSSYDWHVRADVPTKLWYKCKAPRQSTRRSGRSFQPTQPTSIEVVADSDEVNSAVTSDSDDDEVRPAVPEIIGKVGPSEPLFWGYGVSTRIEDGDALPPEVEVLDCFKLMLASNSEDTKDLRDRLMPKLNRLKKNKTIQKGEDVIVHYLEQLFRHTRAELLRLKVYDDMIAVEFVLCVPAVWSSKACRTMERAMAKAVEKSGLGTLQDGSLRNLFIVSEPEAAAACVLAEDKHDINDGEVVVIIDAGGGTIDAVTYRVASARPLRLAEEVVPPATECAGSSYLDREFKALLQRRLRTEKYLENKASNKTLESIIDSKVVKFERDTKRDMDTTQAHFEVKSVHIDGLRENKRNKISLNKLDLTRKEMRRVFEGPLNKAEGLLRHQLDLVKEQRLPVPKVILLGGFGQSTALQSHLRNFLKTERDSFGEEIQPLTPKMAETTVARGAILRAFDTGEGLTRTSLCSYGLLRDELYEPEEIPAHSQIHKPKTDPADGEVYVTETIDWQIQKGQILKSKDEWPIPLRHTFQLHEDLICEETLYVSDFEQESHYRRTHPKNKSNQVEKAHTIKANMNFLKEEGLIWPELPSESSTFHGDEDKKFWAVAFDLVMIIDGRNLRYEARWPQKGSIQAENGLVPTTQVKGQISIASGLGPGTF